MNFIFLLFIISLFISGCKNKDVANIEKYFDEHNNLTFKDIRESFGEYSWCDEAFNTETRKSQVCVCMEKKLWMENS